jgi:NitT/TauT family transport system ATP-binding protein
MSIIIKSLTKKFGNQVVFYNIDLTIPLNTVTVLTGPSGCGKTTLLRIIAGLDKDYHGEVKGVPQNVSFMFQEDRLLPWKNVRNNIDFVLKDILDKDKSEAAVKEMIDSVQLTGHENKTPSKLSGGMKRRVAMARAYCYPAEIYLLDEPFKGFDTKLLEDMIYLFKSRFADTGKTVILVTHDESMIAGTGFNKIDIGIVCKMVQAQ